jgi:outer membrane protein OmpA-like peptidoglycan-associated protein
VPVVSLISQRGHHPMRLVTSIRSSIALFAACWGCASPAVPASKLDATPASAATASHAGPTKPVEPPVAAPASAAAPTASTSVPAPQRLCQPGYRCFDGCNWRWCDSTGSHFTQTDLSCSLVYAIRFQRGTSEPVDLSLSPAMRDPLKRRLQNPQRRLRLVGYAEETEAADDALRRQLAQARAERVRQLLIKEGIAARRLQVEVGDSHELRADNSSLSLELVVLRNDPPDPVRGDFEPSSPEYQHFCGAR